MPWILRKRGVCAVLSSLIARFYSVSLLLYYQGLYDYPTHSYNVFTEPGACDYTSTPHTWTHSTPVDPTAVDAPYTSYQVDGGSTQLYDARGAYTPTKTHTPKHTWHAQDRVVSPGVLSHNAGLLRVLKYYVLFYTGVYDNVLAQPDSPVYDSSPQTWTHSEPVDPCSFDAPYSSYAVTDTGVSLADAPAAPAQLDYPGVYDNVLAEPDSVCARVALVYVRYMCMRVVCYGSFESASVLVSVYVSHI